jgi:hypothetical protein
MEEWQLRLMRVTTSEVLRKVVGSEKEQEYRRAFELLASFQKTVNENIASPLYKYLRTSSTKLSEKCRKRNSMLSKQSAKSMA